MQITCGVLYLMFSDSSLQQWNQPQNLPEFYKITKNKTKDENNLGDDFETERLNIDENSEQA